MKLTSHLNISQCFSILFFFSNLDVFLAFSSLSLCSSASYSFTSFSILASFSSRHLPSLFLCGFVFLLPFVCLHFFQTSSLASLRFNLLSFSSSFSNSILLFSGSFWRFSVIFCCFFLFSVLSRSCSFCIAALFSLSSFSIILVLSSSLLSLDSCQLCPSSFITSLHSFSSSQLFSIFFCFSILFVLISSASFISCSRFSNFLSQSS